MVSFVFLLATASAQDWGLPPPETAAVGEVFVPGPPGANILLDGKPTGLAAPATLQAVSVGPHVVGLRRDCDGVDVPVQVRPGSIERAEAILVRGPASVAIGVSVDGAAVWLDGMSVGQAPVGIQHTSCGLHTVEAEAPGFARATAEFKLGYGESLPVTLSLSMIEAGNIAVSVRPYDAEVWVDGRRRGVGPMTVNALAVGVHEVEAKAKGWETGRVPAAVKGGETTRVDLALLPAKTFAQRHGLDRVDWPRVGVASGLAAAAVGSGVFAATQFLSADAGYAAYRQLSYLDNPDAFYAENVESPTTVAYGLSGLAVATLGSSAYLLMTLRPTTPVTPLVAPGAVGVTGSF